MDLYLVLIKTYLSVLVKSSDIKLEDILLDAYALESDGKTKTSKATLEDFNLYLLADYLKRHQELDIESVPNQELLDFFVNPNVLFQHLSKSQKTESQKKFGEKVCEDFFSTFVGFMFNNNLSMPTLSDFFGLSDNEDEVPNETEYKDLAPVVRMLASKKCYHLIALFIKKK
jgi:hypothetical protein